MKSLKCKINISCFILAKRGILTGRKRDIFYYKKVHWFKDILDFNSSGEKAVFQKS